MLSPHRLWRRRPKAHRRRTRGDGKLGAPDVDAVPVPHLHRYVDENIAMKFYISSKSIYTNVKNDTKASSRCSIMREIDIILSVGGCIRCCWTKQPTAWGGTQAVGCPSPRQRSSGSVAPPAPSKDGGANPAGPPPRERNYQESAPAAPSYWQAVVGLRLRDTSYSPGTGLMPLASSSFIATVSPTPRFSTQFCLARNKSTIPFFPPHSFALVRTVRQHTPLLEIPELQRCRTQTCVRHQFQNPMIQRTIFPTNFPQACAAGESLKSELKNNKRILTSVTDPYWGEQHTLNEKDIRLEEISLLRATLAPLLHETDGAADSAITAQFDDAGSGGGGGAGGDGAAAPSSNRWAEKIRPTQWNRDEAQDVHAKDMRGSALWDRAHGTEHFKSIRELQLEEAKQCYVRMKARGVEVSAATLTNAMVKPYEEFKVEDGLALHVPLLQFNPLMPDQLQRLTGKKKKGKKK